jgi:hypothetical protein
MSRKASASAPALIEDESDLDAYLNSEAANETQENVADLQEASKPAAKPFANSQEAFFQLRTIISQSPRRAQASALFNGRYRSGVFSPEGREALYPYLGARRIYPEGMKDTREKLLFVESLLPSPDPIINLLPVDLARLALAAGIELPPEFQPDTLKATLQGSSSGSRASGDEWS